MSNIWIYVMSHFVQRGASQPDNQPVCSPILPGKNFNVGDFLRTFQQTSVTPTVVIGTIDIYSFISL